MNFSLQTVSRALYAFSLVVVTCLVFVLVRPLPEVELEEPKPDYLVFRAVPSDTRIYKSKKANEVNEDDFLGKANTEILKSTLEDTRTKFFIIYQREGFKTYSEPFEKDQFVPFLSGGAHPSRDKDPVFLKSDSFPALIQLKFAAYPIPFILFSISLIGAGVTLRKQLTMQKQADFLKNLKAQAAGDPYISTKILDYRLTKTLGKGGQGAVYKAVPDHLLGTSKADESAVAVKLCILGNSPEEERERFQIEINALKELKGHPNIVDYIEDGLTEADDPDERLPFLVLEYVHGKALDELVCERETKKVERHGRKEFQTLTKYFKIEPKQIVDYLGPIANALQAAHDKKIFHRDLKPLNIRIAEDGRPVLLDFGLSKMEDNSITRTGIAMGTPGYIPAEQVMDTKRVDHKADIFAMGAIIFHMLSGRSFHEESDVMAILSSTMMDKKVDLATEAPDLDPEIIKVIHKMMAVDGTSRYDSISEAFHDFEEAVKASTS